MNFKVIALAIIVTLILVVFGVAVILVKKYMRAKEIKAEQLFHRLSNTKPEDHTQEDIDEFYKFMGIKNTPLKYNAETYALQAIVYSAFALAFLLAASIPIFAHFFDVTDLLIQLIKGGDVNIINEQMAFLEDAKLALSLIMYFGAFIFYTLSRKAKNNRHNAQMQKESQKNLISCKPIRAWCEQVAHINPLFLISSQQYFR